MPLSPRAMRLLAVLLERAPNVVTKDALLAEVWNDANVEEGTIAYHINLLRRTLDDSSESCIQTVRSRGYRFASPLTVTEAGRPAETGPPGVHPPTPSTEPGTDAHPVPARRRSRWPMAAGLLLGASAATWAWQQWSQSEVRIAVMPFRATSTATEGPDVGEAFGTAVADVLDSLGAASVPPSAFGRNDNAFAAAAGADADLMLTGSVQDADGTRTVTAALFRVADRTRLWTSTLQQPLHQEALVTGLPQAIAVQSHRRLSAIGVIRPAQSATPSREAYDRFVQAGEQWRLRTPHAIARAIALYEEAIALDPQFARAYTGLANCYNLTVSGLPPEDRHARARRYAVTALTLAPDSAEAETSMAFLRYKFERRWADADAGFRRAIALDPDYALARHWYGEFLFLIGRSEDGLAQLETARMIQPRDLAIMNDLIPVMTAAGQLDRADAVLADALAIDPNWFSVASRQAQILMARRRVDESMDATWRSLLLRGVPVADVDTLREGYRRGGLAGYRSANIAMLLTRAAEPSSPAFFGTATQLSREYALLCEPDEAIRWYEIAFARMEDAPLHLLQGDYDCLAGDPRFERIIDDIGFRDAWNRRHPPRDDVRAP